MKTHKAMARTAKSNPIGSRKLRGWFRRVKIRRLYIGFVNFTSDYRQAEKYPHGACLTESADVAQGCLKSSNFPINAPSAVPALEFQGNRRWGRRREQR